jgi:hypothetical protein
MAAMNDILKTFVRDCLAILEEKKLREMEAFHEAELRAALGYLPEID